MPSTISTLARPPSSREWWPSTHMTLSSGSSSREGISSGRNPTWRARSAVRAAWLAERTEAKVATASTRVPPAVASDEIVTQSAIAGQGTGVLGRRAGLGVGAEDRAAAVDGDGGAGDEAGLLGQEVGDHGRDLVGAADPADGVELAHLVLDAGRTGLALGGQEGLVALGVDRAEGDGVDPDARGAVVDGHGPGEALDGRLGGGVGEGAGDGPAGLVGGDVDDRPAAAAPPEPADGHGAADHRRGQVQPD